jgi:hypothetical protein
MPDYIRHAQDTYLRLRANELQWRREKDALGYEEAMNALLKKRGDQALADQRKSLKRQRKPRRREDFIQEMLHRYKHDEEFRKLVDDSLTEGAAALRKGYRHLKAWMALNFPARP